MPTCGPEERIADARDRAREAGFDRSVVVNEARVVFGLLLQEEWAKHPESYVESVMRAGPVTFRPYEPVRQLTERMRERGATSMLATTPDGKLVGLLYRKEAERIVRRP